MAFLARPTVLIAFAFSCAIDAPTYAQYPPKPQPKAEGESIAQDPIGPPRGIPQQVWDEWRKEIKPLPPVAIPDDPPPHEGAFFDLPMVIEPPDIIIVELLEGLPGRPITGERLVRPDGTISMGFYGDVYVRGLTLPQAKTKIILQLRRYIIDEVLGLVNYQEIGAEEDMPDEAMPGQKAIPLPEGGRSPFDDAQPPSTKPVVPKPESPPAEEAKPQPKPEEKKPDRLSSRRSRRRPGVARFRRARLAATQEPAKPERPELPPGAKPQEPAVPPMLEEEGPADIVMTVVEPADSQRCFVDFSGHNSRIYYVQGDVGTPGRLPFQGKETVLDALNYAGGLIPSSEPLDIHLYRPARGGKPAKDYKIDLDAIRKGDAKANLQVFPNDRLVVGRNSMVMKNVEIDRAASVINSLMNAIMQYSFTTRSVGVMNTPPSGGLPQVRVNGQNVPLADPPVMTPARRDALIQEWVELLWSMSSKEGGAMLDEKAFKEALMKKLAPTPEPK